MSGGGLSAAQDQARAMLAEALGMPAEEVPDNASADNLEAWDSLAHLRLVLALEAKLGRMLGPDTVLGVTSIHAIAALL